MNDNQENRRKELLLQNKNPVLRSTVLKNTQGCLPRTPTYFLSRATESKQRMLRSPTLASIFVLFAGDRAVPRGLRRPGGRPAKRTNRQ